MTILKRVPDNIGFTMISNQILQDNSLSLTARGLLSYLLSMPPNWQINVNHLLTMFPEGKSRVSNAWKELQEAGYVRKRMLRADGRIAGWDYEVSQDSGNQESSISRPLKNNILESENLENKNLEIRTHIKKEIKKQTVEKEKSPLPPVGGSEPPAAFASVGADAQEADEQPEDEDVALRAFVQAAMGHKRPEPPTPAPEPTPEPSPFDEPKPKRKRREKKLETFDELERPDWLTDEIWRSYVEHRQAIKKPLTEQAAKIAISKLTLMANSKSPATAASAIENSILNGWSGLFEPRGGHYGERPLTQAERNQQFWAERDAQQHETKIINPEGPECQPNKLVSKLLERCQSSSRGASPRS